MTVTHNGKQYTATKLANGHMWQLTEIGNPRHKMTFNRDQMINAWLGHVVASCIVDTRTLRAALSKKAIARYLEDTVMLQQAIEAQRKALGVMVNRNSFEVRV
ncbi:host cell division inhibitory peptide Kil [Citrobacter freundii]|nr:host cell division inhibitory peptide Kil [Citrobacter freundii]